MMALNIGLVLTFEHSGYRSQSKKVCMPDLWLSPNQPDGADWSDPLHKFPNGDPL